MYLENFLKIRQHLKCSSQGDFNSFIREILLQIFTWKFPACFCSIPYLIDAWYILYCTTMPPLILNFLKHKFPNWRVPILFSQSYFKKKGNQWKQSRKKKEGTYISIPLHSRNLYWQVLNMTYEPYLGTAFGIHYPWNKIYSESGRCLHRFRPLTVVIYPDATFSPNTTCIDIPHKKRARGIFAVS